LSLLHGLQSVGTGCTGTVAHPTTDCFWRKRQGSNKTPTTKQIAFLNLDSMPGIDGLYTPTYTAAKKRKLI